MLKTVTAIRYVTPLREGGSLPAIVETDDGSDNHELYVVKFVGAGQGAKALIAELIAGEIGRTLGLPVPELAFVELDSMLGRSEPNIEIRDLLQASVGLNLGLRYLSNAFAFSPMLKPPPDPILASSIVWFDAYVTNVDRTARNVNMLIWPGDNDGETDNVVTHPPEHLWLIDHGAALYFHHNWGDFIKRSQSPFVLIKDHVLLPFASALKDVDAQLRSRLTPERLKAIVNYVPDHWLGDEEAFANCSEHRAAYVTYLLRRLDASSLFVEEAVNARDKLV